MTTDKVPAYGEDAEARAMNQPATASEPPAKVPDDAATPAAGTTETDLARNIAEANARKAALKE